MLTWTIMDIIFFGKPSIIGAINGMITGLVAITPAAGVIAGWGAIIFGLCSGSFPWVSMNIAGKRWKIFTHHVDDTLGIVHTHMFTGVLGGFLTGLFATSEGCAAFGILNPGGAIDGNGKQVWLQIVGALFIIGWNIVWTTLIMWFIKYVCRIPLRMSDEDLLIGDDAIHGEEAYCFLDENVTGLIPSETAELRAEQRMVNMMGVHGETDMKGQTIIGQDIGGGGSSEESHELGDMSHKSRAEARRQAEEGLNGNANKDREIDM